MKLFHTFVPTIFQKMIFSYKFSYNKKLRHFVECRQYTFIQTAFRMKLDELSGIKRMKTYDFCHAYGMRHTSFSYKPYHMILYEI